MTAVHDNLDLVRLKAKRPGVLTFLLCHSQGRRNGFLQGSLIGNKALTIYEWPKMITDAQQKCSLFLRKKKNTSVHDNLDLVTLKAKRPGVLTFLLCHS